MKKLLYIMVFFSLIAFHGDKVYGWWPVEWPLGEACDTCKSRLSYFSSPTDETRKNHGDHCNKCKKYFSACGKANPEIIKDHEYACNSCNKVLSNCKINIEQSKINDHKYACGKCNKVLSNCRKSADLVKKQRDHGDYCRVCNHSFSTCGLGESAVKVAHYQKTFMENIKSRDFKAARKHSWMGSIHLDPTCISLFTGISTCYLIYNGTVAAGVSYISNSAWDYLYPLS